MGNGMCSRKQKRIFQTLLLLTVVFGFLYGAMLYYELQAQLRKAEAVAQKYQQHQESLSAQLQGTVSGARRPAGNFAPSLPPGWESGFGEQFGIAGATSDLRGHQRRALQGRRVPSVRGIGHPRRPGSKGGSLWNGEHQPLDPLGSGWAHGLLSSSSY